MHTSQRDVAVTGLGAVCAVGGDCASLWDAVLAGRDGIESITRFSTEAFGVHTGAEVKPWAVPPPANGRAAASELCFGFAETAAREAWRDARVDETRGPRERIGLVFGTGLGDLEQPIHLLAERLAEALGCQGPRITVSTACSSSAGALGLARDLISMGSADVVIAGGADVLTPEVFAGFHALGVLSPEKCAPFSFPFGTTLGEGAGFVVLERGDVARRRGAELLAALSGFGMSGDAYHETSPEPRGAGVERALRAALADAALRPEHIGYVNVHGSGTQANDRSEWQGIQGGLGAHAQRIPLSSSKGTLGHAQGAAGVLEAIVTILARCHGLVPPTLHFTCPRPQTPPDPVPGPLPRAHGWRHALCLNSAFGGSNAAVVLSAPDHQSQPRTRRPVYVLGTGTVGPWGLGSEAFLDAVLSGTRKGAAVPPFAIEDLVPSGDPRRLDPLSRFLSAACALAVRDAGVSVHGRLRDRTGLIVGTLRPSATSLAEFAQSIEERGLPGLSASAFARIVLNAASGAASKLLSLRGPLTTITTGAGSGLAAVVHAAEMLSTRDDLAVMLAGGADEISSDRDSSQRDEGAACLLLGAAATESGRTRRVRLAGWGITGPRRLADAVGLALAMAGLSSAQPIPTYPARNWGLRAAHSAFACAEAVLALRRGCTDRALVTSDEGSSAATAVLLTIEGA